MTETEFNNYSKIIKGIAMQMGKNCEVVLHDYSHPYDSTIVAIENSHITGRKIGDCGTNLGLQILSGVTSDENQYNYITQLKNGRILRSSSIYLRNDNNDITGAICINLDITDLLAAKNVLESLSMASNFSEDTIPKPQEFIANDINTMLDSMLEKAVESVGVPVAQMTRDHKIQAIRFLDTHGALLIKKSADKIARYFGISKFTLYNYLEKDETSEQDI